MRRIVIVAFPGVQTLDVVGPAEVFSMADGLANGGACPAAYRSRFRTRGGSHHADRHPAV